MDTRNKILAPDGEWPDLARPVVIVTGFFDVLLAEHARELQQARRETGAAALLVVVLARTGELLPLRARLELVAALRMVDYATTADPSRLDVLIAALQPVVVVRLEEGDERRLSQLRERALAARDRAHQ